MTQSMAEFLHAQGRAEGQAEGRAEGQAEGALISSREILQDLLEKRFGPLPEDLRRRIDSATDLQRLKACIHQILALNSLDELPL